MCSRFEELLFEEECWWLTFNAYTSIFPSETWDRDPEHEEIIPEMEYNFPRKDRRKGSLRHKNLRRDKVTRQENLMTKSYNNYGNHPEKCRRFLKRYAHKVARQGRMPHTRYYLIAGTEYYDGAYHNSKYAVL